MQESIFSILPMTRSSVYAPPLDSTQRPQILFFEVRACTQTRIISSFLRADDLVPENIIEAKYLRRHNYSCRDASSAKWEGLAFIK